jgi:hypothetical protein
MTVARGRHCHVDTSGHFCPHTPCASHGGVGVGHLRANGHPHSRRWRPLLCRGCHGSFRETTGTLLHAKQIEPARRVWAIAALADGLGSRAAARVFEMAPNPVRTGLDEAAAPREAFSRALLPDIAVEQVQMDARLALRSAMQDGEMTEDDALQRLSRSPP